MSKLQNQVINSVKWTAIQTVFTGLSAPILLLVKARYLTPAEFGILAIATIFIGLIQTLNNFGISQAIIQKDEVTEKEISTIFIFNMIFVSFLSMTLYVLAEPISQMFSLEALSSILEILCLMIIISGPALLFRALLEKTMNFKLLSLIQIIAEIILLSSTTLLLFLGYGMLGVVLGQILSTIVSVILIILASHSKTEYRISFYFNIKKLKPFISFGIFVTGKEVITFISHRIDQIIIGYYLPAETLGLYSFAKNMLERVRILISASFSKVLFPLLSKLKNNQEKLTKVYENISIFIAIIAIPLFLGIALTAEFFVPILFGDKWVESILFFQVFSIIMIPLVLTANVSTSLLYSVNKPDTVLYIDLVTTLFYLLGITFFAPQGIYYVLGTYSMYVLFKTLTLQYISNKSLSNSFISYVFAFKGVLVSTFSMTLVILAIQYFMKSYVSTTSMLLLSIISGLVIYGLLVTLLERKGVSNLWAFIVKRKLIM